jgi:hypothetical protein
MQVDRTGAGLPTRLRLSTERWPLVVLTWPAGRRSDEEVRVVCDALREVVARDREHVLLVDARRASVPTPAQLREILRLPAELEGRTRCRATAYLVATPSIKAVLDSIGWMKIGRQELASFRTLAEGERWLRGFLDFP